MMTISQLPTPEIKRIAKIIIDEIEKGNIRNKNDLLKFKKILCSKYALERIPSDSEILQSLDEKRREILKVLMRKPVRTLSGVAIIAVMTSPHHARMGDVFLVLVALLIVHRAILEKSQPH